MKNCALIPRVKNKEGEFTDSKLFTDLMRFTENRNTSKEYYAVGTSEEFISKFGTRAEYDENGEITFSSLQKLTKMNINNDKLKLNLEKDLGVGEYSYSDAMVKLQNFNRNSSFKNDYMGVLEEGEKGKVKLLLVDKNTNNDTKLANFIGNRNLQDRIIYRLNKAGVNVNFIKDGEKKYDGRYSTKNANKTADAMYQLIEVANNKNIDTTLAEEAGHFAIGALGEENPLVKRLTALLTPDVQAAIMGDEYDSVKFRDDPAREVAGHLVGKALKSDIDKKAPWKKYIRQNCKQC